MQKNEKVVFALKENDIRNYLIGIALIIASFFIGYIIGFSKKGKIIEDQKKQAFELGVSSVKPLGFDEQLKNVAAGMKKNPQAMKDFLGEAVDIAVKANPSFAIQVEEYASENIRNKMENLKKEAGILQFARQKDEIAALGVQLASLKKELEFANKKSSIIPQLESKISRLSGVEKFSENLRQQNIQLQKEVLELKAGKKEMFSEGVPVMVHNTWNYTRMFVKIISSDGQKYWSFALGSLKTDDQRIINLQPGEYVVEFYQGSSGSPSSFYKKRNITVTSSPSVIWISRKDGKEMQYYGLITPP